MYFINDFPKILEDWCESLKLNDKFIPCLLYAGDLVLFSDTKQGLQSQIDISYKYHRDWVVSWDHK